MQRSQLRTRPSRNVKIWPSWLDLIKLRSCFYSLGLWQIESLPNGLTTTLIPGFFCVTTLHNFYKVPQLPQRLDVSLRFLSHQHPTLLPKMPRLIFKIGIEGYFMLELQLGSPSLTAGTINTDESNPEPAHGATPAIPDDKLLPSQAPHNMTVSSTEEPVLSNTTPACGNISVLPSEIRMIICKMLLTPDALIYDAHTLIDVKQSLVPSQIPRIQGLDARLLRTCMYIFPGISP